MDQWLQTTVAAVGGGLIVAAFNSWRTSNEARIARDVDHLSKQITELYGPLHYLCESNNGLRARSKQLYEATDAEYVIVPAPADSETSKAIEHNVERCGRIQEQYAKAIVDNQLKIIEAIESHHILIDVDDLPMFHRFLLNNRLNDLEMLEHGRTFPPKIFVRLSPDYSTPGFSELIAQRYTEKQAAMAGLRKHWSMPTWSEFVQRPPLRYRVKRTQ